MRTHWRYGAAFLLGALATYGAWRLARPGVVAKIGDEVGAELGRTDVAGVPFSQVPLGVGISVEVGRAVARALDRALP